MHFYDPQERERKELVAGVMARTFWGERMLMSLVDLEPNAVIPEHTHPHEQVGMVVSGEMRLTIAGETKQARPGDVYIIPGDATHGVVVGDAACQLIEVFSPVREEYKY